MPFTFSHPALVVPLLRKRWRWVSATGLIAGSIAPDFEKFISFRLNSEHSHTWFGLFYFSLPMALALAYLYHGLIRGPLVQNLPLNWYRRLAVFQSFNWPQHLRRHWAAVGMSALVGAWSHLVWDRFTHFNSGALYYLPVLAQRVPLGLAQPRLYELLATLGSVLGGVVVWWALHGLPVRPTAPPVAHRAWFWGSWAGSTTALLGLWAALALPVRQFWDAPVAGLSCAMAGLVLAATSHIIRYPTLGEKAGIEPNVADDGLPAGGVSQGSGVAGGQA